MKPPSMESQIGPESSESTCCEFYSFEAAKLSSPSLLPFEIIIKQDGQGNWRL
jgi:hypothetical protein